MRIQRTQNLHNFEAADVSFCSTVQAAYENTDSAAMALQAVAPIGVKHLRTEKLVMKEKAVLLQTVLADS